MLVKVIVFYLLVHHIVNVSRRNKAWKNIFSRIEKLEKEMRETKGKSKPI